MEIAEITLTGWVAVVVALSMVILAGLMFILGTKRTHFVWGIFCLVTAMWAGSFYFVTLSKDAETALFWWKIAYANIILVPSIFIHFVLEFIDEQNLKKSKKIKIALAYVAALAFLIFNSITNFIIGGVKILFDGLYYVNPGLFHPYFTALYVLIIFYAYYLVYNEYRNRFSDTLFRHQVKYFFFATLIGLVGASMNFLPVYNINIHPTTNLSVVIGSALVAYAILRYKLFDIRVVMAQILTLILLSLSFIRLLLSSSIQETIFDISSLIFVLLIGIYLILSVKNEVTQREKIEKLAGELAGANDKLKKVNSQLEVSNIKLKELDKQKTEFVSIASHQLRSPLTAIKGYTSMLLEGSYGAFEDRGREVLDRVLQSTNKLNTVIEDFLNITRIELGRMKYELSVFDLGQLVEGVVKDQRPNVEKKGLTIEFQDGSGNHQISADSGKVSQVISNLIDNAIKYTEKGWIKVTVENVADKKKEKVRFIVADSGIGLEPEAIKKLFNKFVRADGAGKINIQGTGLGLYVAKQIVEGLGGQIKAESEGKGQGSRFIVEFPHSDQPVSTTTASQVEAYLSADLPDKAGTKKDLGKRK